MAVWDSRRLPRNDRHQDRYYNDIRDLPKDFGLRQLRTPVAQLELRDA